MNQEQRKRLRELAEQKVAENYTDAYFNPQAILSLLDRVERLEAFVIRCKNHSQCAATVLVAAQVLGGHDVREEL